MPRRRSVEAVAAVAAVAAVEAGNTIVDADSEVHELASELVPMGVSDVVAVAPEADPKHCNVVGLKDSYTMAEIASFTIAARDAAGRLTASGGEGIFVAIRGASRVRARIARSDEAEGGTYTVVWKPMVSGRYTIAVSLFGMPLSGSPFNCLVHDSAPWPSQCEVRGDSLHRIVARVPSHFEISYRDRAGRTAQAVELDVFIVPLHGTAAYGDGPEHGSARRGSVGGSVADQAGQLQPIAWEVATAAPSAGQSGKEVREQGSMEEDGAWRRRGVAKRKERGKGGGSKGGKRGLEGDSIEGMAEQGSGSVGVMDGPPASAPSSDGQEDHNESAEREELLSPSDRMTMRRRAIAIQVVCERPLLVRAGPSLASEAIAHLMPEQLATVIEERISPDGDVRGCVVFDEQPHQANGASPAAGGDGSKIDAPHTADTSTVDGGDGDESHSPPPLSSKATPQAATEGTPIATPTARPTAGPAPLGALESAKARQLTGWVTLKKGGKALVTSSVRVDPWSRNRANLLWRMQQLNDRLQLDLQTEQKMLDPTNVGFAFGGVHPGHLHSKGQLHDTHKVHYSIGRVGRYLLHVRLRQAARSLPGSPFALEVSPGPAHFSTTRLAPPAQPLEGEVGMLPTEGCSMVLHTHDRSGNQCTSGGANVTLVCVGAGADALETAVSDQGDGSYLLSWHSKFVRCVDSKARCAPTLKLSRKPPTHRGAAGRWLIAVTPKSHQPRASLRDRVCVHIVCVFVSVSARDLSQGAHASQRTPQGPDLCSSLWLSPRLCVRAGAHQQSQRPRLTPEDPDGVDAPGAIEDRARG